MPATRKEAAIAAAPRDEEARLVALHQLAILDTPPEPQFDRIARLASELLEAPISTVTLIDEARQWFKAKIGIDGTGTDRSISFCTHAIEQDTMMVVEDATADDRFVDNPLVTGAPDIRFYAGMPLTLSGGENVGTLCVIDRVPRTLTDVQRHRLEDLAAIVVDEMELRRANRLLTELAVTDAMTGLMNRRAFFAAAERESARAARYGGGLSMLMLDIDRFKLINDQYGHETGDRAIIAVARGLLKGVRREALVCRMGGDEFVIALPETKLAEIEPIGERLRVQVAEAAFETDQGMIRFTISIGGTEHMTGEKVSETLARADDALYQSKRAGRDLISVVEGTAKSS